VKGKFQGKIVNTRCVKFFENNSNRQKGQSVDLDEKFILKTNSVKDYISSSKLHLSLGLCSNDHHI